MTSEICIMNRHAVALAADSATTVTQWVGGQREERYFKGANKIFQISNLHPVGLMVFDSADLQKVPWEILIKDFRFQLKGKSFNLLSEYADELFEYIKGHHHLFPPTYQQTVFEEEAATVAYRYAVAGEEQPSVRNAVDDATARTEIASYLASEISRLDAQPAPHHFDQTDIDSALLVHKAKIASEVSKTLQSWGGKYLLADITQLVELAIKALYKEYSRYLNATGLVVTGYGDHDFFPSLMEYECRGLILGKLLVDKKDALTIDYGSPSHIKPFATSSMVDTFVMGISPDTYAHVRIEADQVLREFAEKIRADLGISTIPNLDTHVAQAVRDHTDRYTRQSLQNHLWPLRRVIGSLPVDEMAELAETLINLQSLKEKVTKPTESVGGPIDVAVITKGDGFIWIKRKHYFDAKLNSRFFLRQSARFQ